MTRTDAGKPSACLASRIPAPASASAADDDGVGVEALDLGELRRKIRVLGAEGFGRQHFDAESASAFAITS